MPTSRSLLKGEVNYRVFTNQTGLYIEFPVLKEPGRQTGKRPPAAAPVDAARGPGDSAPPRPTRPGERARRAPGRPGAGAHPFRAGPCPDETEYRVIPIEQQPVRLAIDLKNAQSKKISKTVNLKNVKGIRGSNNSGDIYRVVFDLEYLKHFAVQAKGNVLQVEFFDDPQPAKEAPVLAQAAAPAPARRPPLQAVADRHAAGGGAARRQGPPGPVLQGDGRRRPEPAATRTSEFFGPEKSKAEEEEAAGIRPR